MSDGIEVGLILVLRIHKNGTLSLSGTTGRDDRQRGKMKDSGAVAARLKGVKVEPNNLM